LALSKTVKEIETNMKAANAAVENKCVKAIEARIKKFSTITVQSGEGTSGKETVDLVDYVTNLMRVFETRMKQLAD
jgi:hypothetical protein